MLVNYHQIPNRVNDNQYFFNVEKQENSIDSLPTVQLVKVRLSLD